MSMFRGAMYILTLFFVIVSLTWGYVELSDSGTGGGPFMRGTGMASLVSGEVSFRYRDGYDAGHSDDREFELLVTSLRLTGWNAVCV